MGIKTYNPYTPSRRQMTGSDFSEITKTTPEKSLLDSKKRKAGRNAQGKITVRAEAAGKNRRNFGGAADQPSDPSLDEAGTLYGGKYRAFWSGSGLLLPFYFTDPPVSGSADPPDYQGQSAGASGRKAHWPLYADTAGGCKACQ